MSGEHPRVQPQFADPDFSPAEQPPAPQPRSGVVTPPPRAPRPPSRGGSVETSDQQGRKITIRKLGALERMDLFEMLGATLSENVSYVAHAMSAACVTSIDGVPVPFPASKKALRRLVEQLGDDGLEAATAAYRENFSAGESGDKNDVKN